MKTRLQSILFLLFVLMQINVFAQTAVLNDFRSKSSGFWTNIGVTVAPNITAVLDGAGKVASFTVNTGGTFSLASGSINVYCTGGGGNGAYGTATVAANTITTIALGNGGSGYTTVPTVLAAANSTTIWEKCTTAGNPGVWTDVALGTGPSSSAPTITIQSGHIVTLTTTAVSSCNNLTIQSTAQLNTLPTASTNATATIRVGGTAPATAVIINDGIFGSAGGTNDGIIMEPNTTCASLTLTGTGSTIISRIRPTPPNVNSLVFTIDQDITLNYGLASFTAYYNSSSNTAAENSTFTINAGKVVKTTNVNGGFHGASTNPQGNVTYNINGILDLGLTTQVSSLIGSTNASNTSNSKTTFNIGATGKIITGTGLNISSVGGGTTAPVYFNVASGGIIDGTKLTTLTTAATPNPFVLNGTAQFIRTAATGVATTFPVSTSVSTYNPVILNNSGTSRVFTVTGLQNPIATPTAPSFGHINTKWNITPATAVDGAVSVKLGWQTADQGTFDNAGVSPSVIIYDGSNWVSSGSNAVTGSGTLADPYIETGSFSTFGNFSVGNTATTLPLNLLSFNASLTTGFAKQVNLSWTTANEVDFKDFEVQRSADGKTFTTVANVSSKNTAGSHDYTAQDQNPLNGTSYYRLKQNDLSGDSKYSETKSVKNTSAIAVSVYPNPAASQLNITYPIAVSGATVKITALDGKAVLNQIIAIGSTSTVVDVASLIPGYYIAVVENGSEKTTVKFIKK